jgi:hypothetical protein
MFWILGNGLVVYLMLILATNINGGGFGPLIGRGVVGPFMFHGVCVLVSEKQTFQLVQVTPLTPREIVLGKLWSVLGYIGWLIAAVLPVVAAPMLVGGVAITDVLSALAMLALIAFTIASLSMWVSARAKSTRSAVTVSYLISFALLFFTPLLAVGEAFVQTNRFEREPSGELWSLIPNPYLAVVSAVDHPLELDSPSRGTIFIPGFEYLLIREGNTSLFVNQMPANRIVEEDGHRFVRPSRPPLWILSGLVYLTLSALAIRRASHWVTTPAPREFAVRRLR